MANNAECRRTYVRTHSIHCEDGPPISILFLWEDFLFFLDDYRSRTHTHTSTNSFVRLFFTCRLDNMHRMKFYTHNSNESFVLRRVFKNSMPLKHNECNNSALIFACIITLASERANKRLGVKVGWFRIRMKTPYTWYYFVPYRYETEY